MGTTMVPILSKKSPYLFECLKRKHTNVTLQTNVVPNGTQKILVEKYKFWAFQRRVNHLYSHPRSKVTSHSMFMFFFSYSIEFVKISLFRSKLWKNLQILQGCKNTPRLWNVRYGVWNFFHQSLQRKMFWAPQ